MTNKIRYLLIAGVLMLFSSGAFAGPIVGSITFTGFDGIGEVSVDTLPGALVPGTGVTFELLDGWAAGSYVFDLDLGSLTLSAGMFSGSGLLYYGGSSTLALLSGKLWDTEQGRAFEATTTAVPEPQTLALLGIALLAFGTIRLSRSRNRH